MTADPVSRSKKCKLHVEGNDRIVARDGRYDVIGCGPGRDSVLADRGDLVGSDCEQVVRR